ncbi:MAG: PilZ domain-containing protein [Desulfobacteraceae bacterium]|nr:MAG: PilZ domain-containing protein [Desulfobacteraceae bacterium]
MDAGITTRKGFALMLNAILPADRRMYNRTPCDLHADVDDYEDTYSGQIRNLGKGGAYIEMMMNTEPEIGREVIMTIPFKTRANYLIIKARVAWTAKDGIGVTFLKEQSQ